MFNPVPFLRAFRVVEPVQRTHQIPGYAPYALERLRREMIRKPYILAVHIHVYAFQAARILLAPARYILP